MGGGLKAFATGKSLLVSKTFWVNLAMLAVLIVQAFTGFVVPVQYQVYAMIGINTLLRLVTHQPIEWGDLSGAFTQQQVTGKSVWTSKALWVQALALVAIIVQTFTGFIIPPEYQAYALTAISVLLRLVTKQPIEWAKT